MRNSVLSVLIAVFITACGSQKSNIVFEQKKVEFQASNAEKSAEVNIVYPFATDSTSKHGQVVADSINQGIQKCGILTAIFKQNIGDNAVIDEAKQMLTDSINYTNTCEWSGVRNDNIISFLFQSYYYTGGAHGGIVLTNVTFDAQTGKQLPLMKQITDTTKFLKIFLEEYFAQNNLTLQTPIEDIGYLVPLDQLGIPSTLYLTPEGLVGAYGQYEVAAYVVGITKATIPYEKLQGVLNIDTKGLKKIETVK